MEPSAPVVAVAQPGAAETQPGAVTIASAAGSSATIWIDAEDLFRYAEVHSRPSGIQRLAFEMCAALVALHGAEGRIRFLRHRSYGEGFYAVDWQQLLAAFDGMGIRKPPPPVIAEPSDTLRTRIRHVLQLQGQAFAALGLLIRRLGREISEIPASVATEFDAFSSQVRNGDVILALGSPWLPGYAARIRRVRAERHIRFALTVYDIIPLRHPEWCHSTVTDHFGSWMHGVLPLSDHVFAISRATADDLESYAARKDIALLSRVRPFPIGTGFRPPTGPPEADRLVLPEPGSYVLFVSTIEPRKNHMLLFRVWQRLLAELPRKQVPRLVFAGGIGWMVADLVAQLDNCGWLDGHIVMCKHPTDAELSTLYRGCRFTLFPSLYEGWGLPVTESLSFGKPCMISRATSLPEAGGTLARYFDPESITEATKIIRDTIEDPDDLAAWEAQVVRDFRPVPWADSARSMMAALDAA